MQVVEHLKRRSPYERTFHAVVYELLGIITSAPIISLITNKPIIDSGVLAIIVSITAMIWNYIFNWLFDKVQAKMLFKRNLLIRILHGIIFETGLILLTVPVISFILNMDLVKAFLLELSMLLYFFPYTIIFNWFYDKLRLFIIQKYQ